MNPIGTIMTAQGMMSWHGWRILGYAHLIWCAMALIAACVLAVKRPSLIVYTVLAVLMSLWVHGVLAIYSEPRRWIMLAMLPEGIEQGVLYTMEGLADTLLLFGAVFVLTVGIVEILRHESHEEDPGRYPQGADIKGSIVYVILVLVMNGAMRVTVSRHWEACAAVEKGHYLPLAYRLPLIVAFLCGVTLVGAIVGVEIYRRYSQRQTRDPELTQGSTGSNT